VIEVTEVILDPDMIAPEPFTVLRSTGQFVAGGFQSTTSSFLLFGPVQQSTNKEIDMTPEADRVGQMRTFWSNVPIYPTRGYASTPSTYGEVPQGAIPGVAYTLSTAPPGDAISLYKNGVLLQPGTDYAIHGVNIMLTAPTTSGDKLYATWAVTTQAANSASDIIQYETQQYRVLGVFRVPGSGYWKAVATRLAAA